MTVRKEDVRSERLPTDEDQPSPWKIIRTPMVTPIKVVCVSHDLVGYRVHYWNNRTTVCVKEGCPACLAGWRSRYAGYVLAVGANDNSQYVFEFTPPPALILGKAFDERGTLRGLNLVFSRRTKKANGAVTVTIRGTNDQAHRLPPDQDTWSILSRIWGLNKHTSPTFAEFSPDSLAEAERVQNAMNQIGDGHDNDWMKQRLSDLSSVERIADDLTKKLSGKNGDSISSGVH